MDPSSRDGAETTPDDPTTGPADSSLGEPVDLDAIAADLTAVEVAMQRIEAGTYWTDEATGQEIPDDVLAADPTARRRTEPAGQPAPAPDREPPGETPPPPDRPSHPPAP